MSSNTALRACVLATWLLAPSGCATAGVDWVMQPESGVHEAHEGVPELEPGAFDIGMRSPLSPGARATPAPHSGAARPRLQHTVSLGEVVAEAPLERREASATALSAPAVVIHQHFTTPASEGWSSSVLLDRSPRSRGTSRPRSPAPRLGQSWPAPPSHGPPFPYKTAPASPWEPAR